MYLSRIYIKNYRSIAEVDLTFSKGKNVIVGRNNAGKSNVIKAIDLMLGETSPTYAKSDNVELSDFHTLQGDDGKAKIAQQLFIWCELTREDGEQLVYEEINKCFGLPVWAQGYKNEKTPCRIEHAKLPKDFSTIFAVDIDDVGFDKMYVDAKIKNQFTFKAILEDKYQFAYAFLSENDGDKVTCKEMRFLFRERSNADWCLAFKPSVRNELLQSAIMHSFRDPQNQLRLSSWTWYGKLIKHLTQEHEGSTALVNAFQAVKKVSDEIFAEVKGEIQSSALNVAFPGTELHFQFNADARTELFRNCVLYVDDGFKSQLTDKGAGIQSATIIGLFSYYVKHVNTVTSALLCLEEPEIYLHPHARRVISDRLDEFLDDNRNQVILTTHSVEFIRSVSADVNIILVRKGVNGTEARDVKFKEFKTLLVDSNKNELFFSESVIVCEGLDEYVLRAVSEELFPGKLDECNVTIVNVQGKNNFKDITNLIIKLGIRCYVLCDFDFLLRDKSEDRKKWNPDAQANECITSLGAKYFSQPCLFGRSGAKVYGRLEPFRESIKKDFEREFYLAKHCDEIGMDGLKEKLSWLRQHGVGILSGEIEHASKDTTFISPTNKLSLDKCYELSRRLADGAKPSDIFETTELGEFLNAVFDRGQPKPPPNVGIAASSVPIVAATEASSV
jgi:putative ATP-dependent endonuclease of the OLD family